MKIIISFLLVLNCLAQVRGQNIVVSTFSGSGSPGYVDGQGSQASFGLIAGLTIDVDGNVYVADPSNQRIRKITPAGYVSTYAGSGESGSKDSIALEATFDYPTDVAVDTNGNVYITDGDNDIIRKIDSNGIVSTIAGSGRQGSDDGQGLLATFNSPQAIAIDAFSNLYVADAHNHLIRKITPNGYVSTIAGSGSGGFANGTGVNAVFNYPFGVTVDKNGNLYIADSQNRKIRKIVPSGEVSTFAGSGLLGSLNGVDSVADFNNPFSVIVDSSGNVYVADQENYNIRKISSSGVVTTYAGSGIKGNNDGTAETASFNALRGITIDQSGNLYISDAGNFKIRKITFNSITSTEKDVDNTVINIFPNPAQGIIMIKIPNAIEGTVQLIDSKGETILSQKMNGKNAQLNIIKITDGVYIIRVLSEEFYCAKQIIVR